MSRPSTVLDSRPSSARLSRSASACVSRPGSGARPRSANLSRPGSGAFSRPGSGRLSRTASSNKGSRPPTQMSFTDNGDGNECKPEIDTLVQTYSSEGEAKADCALDIKTEVVVDNEKVESQVEDSVIPVTDTVPEPETELDETKTVTPDSLENMQVKISEVNDNQLTAPEVKVEKQLPTKTVAGKSTQERKPNVGRNIKTVQPNKKGQRQVYDKYANQKTSNARVDKSNNLAGGDSKLALPSDDTSKVGAIGDGLLSVGSSLQGESTNQQGSMSFLSFLFWQQTEFSSVPIHKAVFENHEENLN